jgi:hypothetical protein
VQAGGKGQADGRRQAGEDLWAGIGRQAAGSGGMPTAAADLGEMLWVSECVGAGPSLP